MKTTTLSAAAFEAGAASATVSGSWDGRHEWKAVTLLILGFGLVGLDRWIIAPLFLAMMQALQLNYSSTAGVIIGSGEIFGGVAPSLAGAVAQNYGLQHTLTMALTGLSLGVIICLFLRETAPRRVASQRDDSAVRNRMASEQAFL